MLGIDAVTGTLAVPIWAAGAVSAVFLAVVVLAIGRSGAAAFINALFPVGIMVVAVSAGWLYMQQAERQERAAERRSLGERSTALSALPAMPGSALSCLDPLAGETVEGACEKTVFATPEAVATAVNYVSAKLALLADANDHVRRGDAAFAAELAALSAALESDRFGIVAHVLAQRYGCTLDRCDALNWFSDSSHLLANLRDHTFDEQVTKFAAMWNAPPRTATEGAVATLPTTTALPNIGAAPVMVSPRYDFPSSQSIPPVNIMIPEPPAQRGSTASTGRAAAPAGEVKPRATAASPRPAQVRAPSVTAGSRPSNPQPIVPITSGEAPADDAVPRSSGLTQQQ